MKTKMEEAEKELEAVRSQGSQSESSLQQLNETLKGRETRVREVGVRRWSEV